MRSSLSLSVMHGVHDLHTAVAILGLEPSGRRPRPVHVRTLAHCCSKRFGETGIAVPSFWAKSETRYSSNIHRSCRSSVSKMPCA